MSIFSQVYKTYCQDGDRVLVCGTKMLIYIHFQHFSLFDGDHNVLHVGYGLQWKWNDGIVDVQYAVQELGFESTELGLTEIGSDML